MSRYNFRLTERECRVDLSLLPIPSRSYDARKVLLYGIDATRYAGFENLESPAGGLKFLNRLWNLPYEPIIHSQSFLDGIAYYMSVKKYHNVIALIRGVIKKEKKLSPVMRDALFPFVPHIIAKLRENQTDV